MKKNSLYFSLCALTLWSASNVYASSCKKDLSAIYNVTDKHGCMFVEKDAVICSVFGPATTRGNQCGGGAKGPGSKGVTYALSWTRGDWGRTLVATER